MSALRPLSCSPALPLSGTHPLFAALSTRSAAYRKCVSALALIRVRLRLAAAGVHFQVRVAAQLVQGNEGAAKTFGVAQLGAAVFAAAPGVFDYAGELCVGVGKFPQAARFFAVLAVRAGDLSGVKFPQAPLAAASLAVPAGDLGGPWC